MEKRPLDYAKASMDTMMRKWEAPKLPPEGRFHYHQGVFLSGMYKSYELCKEEKYFDYIKSWVDAVITEDGVIKQADMGQFDDMQPGILLYPLYHCTGDARYKKALDSLMAALIVIPPLPRAAISTRLICRKKCGWMVCTWKVPCGHSMAQNLITPNILMRLSSRL